MFDRFLNTYCVKSVQIWSFFWSVFEQFLRSDTFEFVYLKTKFNLFMTEVPII